MNQIQSLASRVAPVPAGRGATAATGRNQPAGARQAQGGRGGRSGNSAPKKEKAKPKSAEELDAEMSVS